VEETIAFVDSLGLDAMKLTVGIRIYPNTSLVNTALSEGMITAQDDLLFPRFYIVRGLEDWLREVVSQCMAERPNWVT
jgi:hypothetical protein